MPHTVRIVAAYGRQYPQGIVGDEQIIGDYLDNKDFLIQDLACPWNGSYINKEDAEAHGIDVLIFGSLHIMVGANKNVGMGN